MTCVILESLGNIRHENSKTPTPSRRFGDEQRGPSWGLS